VAEVDRVVDPPGAVVAPEMVGVVVEVDPERRESDRHAALLSAFMLERKAL
jgi:hypothetical protein